MSLSIWLVPNEKSPFSKEIEDLISKMPSNFSSKVEKHKFLPHVTLTSNIDPQVYESSGKSAQEWLDSLSIPTFKKEVDEVVAELDHLEAGEDFFRKLVIELTPNKNLSKLAASCRQATGVDEAAAQQWAEKDFAPHMSLMYADVPKADVKNKLTLIEMQIGFGLGSLFDCCGGSFAMGGHMVLVNTKDEIKDWKPIASRDTPWTNWRMSRNLC